MKDDRSFKVHKFREHGVVEEGCKVLTCDEPGCEFKTLFNFSLRKHKESHLPAESRSRPYSCPVCGKTFLKSTNFKTHLNIHDNAESKPFQCEICGASFAVKNYLYIHNRLSHAGRLFPSTHKKRPSAKKKGKSKNAKASTGNEESETNTGEQDSGDMTQPQQSTSTVITTDTPVNIEATPNQSESQNQQL